MSLTLLTQAIDNFQVVMTEHYRIIHNDSGNETCDDFISHSGKEIVVSTLNAIIKNRSADPKLADFHIKLISKLVKNIWGEGV